MRWQVRPEAFPSRGNTRALSEAAVASGEQIDVQIHIDTAPITTAEDTGHAVESQYGSHAMQRPQGVE